MTVFVFTASGVLLILVVALDVYATILDDRPRVGPVSDTLNRGVWLVSRAVAARLSRTRRHHFLNLIGPLLLPSLVIAYIALLVSGFACVYYPRLATQFRVDTGAATVGWFDAAYFSGATLTTLGYGDIAPRTTGMRLVAVAQSASGLALISLLIAYLIAVYAALERRRTVARSFYHQAEEGANVASFVAHHFVDGRFYGLVAVLRAAARDLQGLLESHIEHPVIHYFHPVEAYKSTPRMIFLTLEMCAVIRSCLDEEEYPETCKHPEVRTLEASARHVLTQFVNALGPRERARGRGGEKFDDTPRWRARFSQTLERLEESGVATKRDRAAGWDEYRENREEWESPLRVLADYLGYDWEEVTGDRDPRHAADAETGGPRAA